MEKKKKILLEWQKKKKKKKKNTHKNTHLIRLHVLFFFMLNTAEHEIFSANKYENANNSWHFHIY